MNDHGHSQLDALPLPLVLEINRLCREFETAQRAGQSPQIEDFIGRIGEEGRPAARRELLALKRRWSSSSTWAVTSPVGSLPGNCPMPCAVDSPDPTPIPERVGRFKIERLLGEGSFGVVYLAQDGELGRSVALKIPNPKRFSSSVELDDFVKEAHTAAQLKHPGIVTIHEFGRDGENVFIVQEYIDGQDLRKFLRAQKPTPPFAQTARLVAAIAEAVAFAHAKGFVHRDLKPANILLDAEQCPRVADFGLAVHETVQRRLRGERSGTPAYMSPEQVRGETNRLDGRSDIWSLGVMLYEMLTRRRPFGGDTNSEIFDEIQRHEPRPPRMIEPKVPAELERICLRCLSRRVTDRYLTAGDLADDLQHWLANGQPPSAVAGGPVVPQVQVVPKGLRSFDAEDAGFFLELVPGPQDRNGLPESIRFWKTRMEETDADRTFAVGLIYGPSGCGKSSLMKAGLLPRLASHVQPVYVEATAEDTEARVLKGLRKVCPLIPMDASLPDVFAALREGVWVPRGKKIVIVLDQFEQWLHARPAVAEEQLVLALRHCDGVRLQAVVMTRDDFAMAAVRFMEALDIPIVQGHNFNTFDLFDVDHTQEVLTRFGQAFRKLSEKTFSLLSDKEREFVRSVATGLATQDGKVVCIRLVLFAEMIKGKPWVPATLAEVGGTTGIGVNFLEETFASRSANPKHLIHQKAARAVLKTLLPEVGTNIKRHMRPQADLRAAAAEHLRRPSDFCDLLQILDGELRLITPTDPEGSKESSENESNSKFYQLTHDYLVPPLRDWLTRKQKETRKGRAELMLEDRAAVWNARPENRQLPSLPEFVNIRLRTQQQDWTEPQRKMMRRAGVVQSRRIAAGFGFFLVVALAFWRLAEYSWSSNSESRVNTAIAAKPEGVEYILPSLKQLRRHCKSRLRKCLEEGKLEPNRKLRAECLLAELGEVHPETIVSLIGKADDGECANVVSALRSTDDVKKLLAKDSQTADKKKEWKLKARIAIVAFHLGDSAIAADMLETENRADPIQRTLFIAEFRTWHAGLNEVPDFLPNTPQEALRSGICLALGSVSPSSVNAEARLFWQPILVKWYKQQPEKGTHSAAGWALRKWNLELPNLPSDPKGLPSDPKREWSVTSLDLTMLKIPAGSFVRTTGADKTIILTHDFLVSDREVSLAQFQRFMKDKGATRPPKWNPLTNDTGSHPVRFVGWYDAVMFCNWLSDEEKLERCYRPTKEDDVEHDEWETVPDADGYRLLTEAEWEYACRAGTTTEYSFGALDDELLPQYAVFNRQSPEPCGSRLPNGWGLFDMHGNIYEWCQDRQGPVEKKSVLKDPQGAPEGVKRVVRGGSFFNSISVTKSSQRWDFDPTERSQIMGFRVTRVLNLR